MYVIALIVQLFCRPSKFFESMDDLFNKTLLFIMTWLVGALTIADQVDETSVSLKSAQKLADSLKDYTSQMGMPLDMTKMNTDVHMLTDSWLNYWGFVLGLGLLIAPLIWYISGWGFNLFIQWSGDPNYNKTYGRMIYIYTSMIYCLPRVLDLFCETVFYKDDNTALDVDAKSISAFLLAVVFAILPFWSWITAYIAVRKNFVVQTKKAIFWFVGLPAVWYFLTLWQPLLFG